jgi:phospholipase A1/A2
MKILTMICCLSLFLPAFADAAQSAASVSGLAECAAVSDETERLACYDRLAGRKAPEAAPAQDMPVSEAEPAAGTPPAPPSESAFDRRWDLDPDRKTGLFRIHFYKPVYFLPVRYSDNQNRLPADQPQIQRSTDNTEAKFQLSFKTKILENTIGKNGDLWFGYTQQSNWQLFNTSESSPFRETVYEPELIYTLRTNLELPGLRWRLLNLGLLHQSNGQSDPFSRSWNRLYAQFGFDRGAFSLMVRPWLRIFESAEDEDNPDIDEFLGHGDILANFKYGAHVFSLLGRYSTTGRRGALQLEWAFPLISRLNGYLQIFSGYGETLIDYNRYQNVFGLGVSLVEWQ